MTDPKVVTTSETAERPARGQGLKAVLRKPVTMVAGIFILLLVIMAVFAPILAPHDPYVQDLVNRLQPPSANHLLGTDDYGRDVLSRLIYGARISLTASLQAVSVALILGLPLGVIAGYRGGWVDSLITRVMDALMSAPSLVLAITIVAVLGSGITNAMLAIGLVMAPRFFRVARASTMDVRHETYIEAAIALGCRPGRTIIRHILPNVMPPVVLVISVSLGAAVAAEASLSFLGLGAKAPAASWGSMLSTAASNMQLAPYLVWPPGVMIFLTVLSFTYLGDGVRRSLLRSRNGDND
ncbi:ABC transporter permease [Rhodococcus sp. ACPA4]|jgi:peptide/nickel transport system permease protein|uniref:Peptide/nickel transport system permease protein/oligopeptide transport system permease protein n=2 Tax=Nocardiaceae TaxID=85025 RepID=A0A652YUZ7_NOCGL|nr:MULTISPECIES: ABC transporter permease [Rhodococcus]NMD60725.1 ABC transporter permease [Nocardia globerula]KJF20847.1 Glutathione transport system permease protein gsiD [Rhodococcus sp. AD45]MCE4263980.1 ABC transporter permease [Rhodococcus globerulus]MDV6269964.1 ABC transporter permease [Rhodococcus globerulus]MDV8010629.1 ABC transporter permease [Rhodococcus sp. IEGM 1241]